jgi:multisubunit Na+/H+ antiporter MnhF subunit
MSVWELAAIVLAGSIVPCVAICLLASAADALVALELASTIATTALMVLAEAYHRQPFIDLAVVLALVSVVGALAFARLMEADI